MTAKQRKMLAKLCELANKLGSPLDYTATSYIKLRDYQIAYMQFHHVLYGVLCDDPNNDYRDQDVAQATESLQNLIKLSEKEYGDRMSGL